MAQEVHCRPLTAEVRGSNTGHHLTFIDKMALWHVNLRVFLVSVLIKDIPLCLKYTNNIYIYRVSQEERTKLQENVPYVELYRYNPKHLYPKCNGYGDNGQRKVWTSCISAYCTSTNV